MGRHTQNFEEKESAFVAGYPPFRMKAREAAYYCGMSPSAFLREAKDPESNLPDGKKLPGGRFWLRSDLERWMLGEEKPHHDFSKKI